MNIGDINVISEGFIRKWVNEAVHKTTIRIFPNQKPLVEKKTISDGDMNMKGNLAKPCAVKERKWSYRRKLESQF